MDPAIIKEVAGLLGGDVVLAAAAFYFYRDARAARDQLTASYKEQSELYRQALVRSSEGKDE